MSRLYRADSIPLSLKASGAASGVSRLIGLARTTALAWLIPQAQFGLLGIALLIVNVLLPLCSAGLYEGVARYAPVHEVAGTFRRFTVRSFVLLAGVAGSAALMLWLLAPACGSVLFSAAPVAADRSAGPAEAASFGGLMRASVLCVVALAGFQTLIGLLRGLRMFRALGAAEVFTAVLFTLLAVGAAQQGYTTARAMILAYASACGVAVLLFAPGLMARDAEDPAKRAGSATPNGRTGSGRPGRSSQPTTQPGAPRAGRTAAPAVAAGTTLPVRGTQTGRLMTYSLWAAGTVLLWHILSYYPMWYLLKVSDRATVGTFHAVRTVTQLVQIAAVLLTGIVSANVTRVWEFQGRHAASAQLAFLTKAVLVLLGCGAGLLSACRPIVMRLFPTAYAEGAAAYDPLVLFFLLAGVVGLTAVRLSLVEKPRLICFAWLAGVIVNVGFAYVLMRPPGGSIARTAMNPLPAAAWAGVAGLTAALAVCLVLVGREKLALHRPAVVLVVAAYAIGLGWMVAVPVLGTAVVTAWTTGLVFTAAERARLRQGLKRVFGRKTA